MVYRAIKLIISHNKLFLTTILLLSVPFGYFYSQQEFNNHMDVYFDKTDPVIVTYKKFQEQYGNDQQFLVFYKVDDVFTKQNLQITKDITSKIETMEGVQRVFSITNAEEASGKNDSITFKKVIPEKIPSKEGLKKIKKHILENRVIVNDIVSADGTTTAIIIELDMLDNIKKRKVIDNIISSSKKLSHNKIELHYTGSPYFETELNLLSKKDEKQLTPLVLFIIILIIYLLLRSIRYAVICFFNLVLISIWSSGFYVAAGEKFNMITIIMGFIILAISIASSIHLLARYQKECGGDETLKNDALVNASVHVFMPCLMAGLTTSAGFLSFIFSSIQPVRVLGVFTACGILFSLMLTFTFLPSVLSLIEGKEKTRGADSMAEKKDDFITSFLVLTGQSTFIHYKKLVIVLLVLFSFMFLGISKISIETNDFKMLKESHPLRKDLDFFEKNLFGSMPYNIVIKAKSQNNNFLNPDSLKLLDRITHSIDKKYSQLSAPYSIADYYKHINQSFNSGDKKHYRIPGEPDSILDYYELGDPAIFDRLITSDHMEARISYQAYSSSNEEGLRVLRELNIYLNNELKQEYEFIITGMSDVYMKMESNIVSSQISSFSIAFVIIFLMMFFICRKANLTLLAMIPNLFPIAMTLGIMGWFRIPLDVATFMIASVTIGIAVDDTIHFTVNLRKNLLSGQSIHEAILSTLNDVGRQIVLTSLILFIGFFILIAGSITPTQAFGVLTAFSMLFALVGDVIILPVLILLFNPEMKKSSVTAHFAQVKTG